LEVPCFWVGKQHSRLLLSSMLLVRGACEERHVLNSLVWVMTDLHISYQWSLITSKDLYLVSVLFDRSRRLKATFSLYSASSSGSAGRRRRRPCVCEERSGCDDVMCPWRLDGGDIKGWTRGLDFVRMVSYTYTQIRFQHDETNTTEHRRYLSARPISNSYRLSHGDSHPRTSNARPVCQALRVEDISLITSSIC
jgi:hypothetical protein